MKQSKHKLSAIRQTAVAVARKLAASQVGGHLKPIGPEFLAAGILKALPDGKEYLKGRGLGHIAPCLEAIPEASAAELAHLPPAELTEEMAILLRGRLRGLQNGSLSVDSALNILLAVPGVIDRLPLLVSANTRHVPMEPGPRELMARVTRMVQSGYALACPYYSAGTKAATSDFAGERPPQGFLQACAEYRQMRDTVHRLMYSGPRGQKLSVFERYMRTYGPIAADVATAVMVNELTPYVCGGALATVRDIAYAIAPYDYHRMAGNVIEAVQTLKKDTLVRLIPEPDYCQMFSGVLPTEALISDFTQYLGGSADW